MDTEFTVDMDVHRGRGYVASEENADPGQPLGTIPVDSIYSPVHRVRYSIEATRVGKLTNYDRLILEIWTDGTVTPELALIEAAKIYRKHLNPFVNFEESRDTDLLFDNVATSEYNETNRETSQLIQTLEAPISDLELSVRARNCLDGANMRTLLDLVTLSENEVMNLKNLGKTSLTEIITKLAERGLSLGMTV
jgi:DNA-directed RNA polymerase subunit alpha